MSEFKVASILDEFSYNCLKYECDLIPLTSEAWKDTLKITKPDLLLVESAWNLDYKKMIKYPSKDNSQSFFDWCKARQIPTIFWNKEDPYHFNFFLEDAKKFDYIFTTDLDSIPHYKTKLGHENVFLLPFAAQPKIHNPIDKDRKKFGKVAFSGTWYRKRPERKADMKMLLDPAIKYGLHIYDRNYNKKNNKNHFFPKAYQPYIKGGLTYDQMVLVYKKYDIFLNVNTVKNSPTMFSRRVFELLACGINVISTYSIGIEKFFSGIVKLVKTKTETERNLEALINRKSLRDKLSLLGQREIFNKHTYGHRMEIILEKIGCRYQKIEPSGISIITWIDTPDSLANVLANFERQSYQKKELILLCHKKVKKRIEAGLEQWLEKTGQYMNLKLFEIGKERAIKEYFKFGADRAIYDYLSWFGADNYYATEFLGDLMNTFKYTDAAIVGKCSHYAYSPKSGSLKIRLPDREYRYTDLLVGSAMIAQRQIFDKIEFLDNPNDNEAELCIITDCNERLYSADRFNYIYKIPLNKVINTKRACI